MVQLKLWLEHNVPVESTAPKYAPGFLAGDDSDRVQDAGRQVWRRAVPRTCWDAMFVCQMEFAMRMQNLAR